MPLIQLHYTIVRSFGHAFGDGFQKTDVHARLRCFNWVLGLLSCFDLFLGFRVLSRFVVDLNGGLAKAFLKHHICPM